MGPFAAVIPAITAVASVAGAAVPLISAFKKPPSAGTPRIPSSSVLSTQDKSPSSGLRQSLINTSPQGLLEQDNAKKGGILGG